MNTIKHKPSKLFSVYALRMFSLMLFPLLLLITISSNTYSYRELKFKRIDLSSLERLQGSLGPINAILQDDYGFVWISSEQGLVRFDGHDFRVYTAGDKDNDIVGNVINDFVLDLDGYLWVATTSGLSKYRSESDDFINFIEASPGNQGLPQSNVTSIDVDKKNRILIGTAGGFSIYDQNTELFIPVSLNRDGSAAKNIQGINDVHYDSRIVNKDVVWLSTHYGVLEIDLLTLKISEHFLAKEEFFVRTSFSDIYGNLWMGTFGNGLIRKSPNGEMTFFRHEVYDATTLGSDTVRHIYADSDHNLWIAMDHGGLNLFDYKKQEFKRFKHRVADRQSISSNQVRYVFEDRDNNLWVGTYFGGINIVGAENFGISTITRHSGENTLNHNAILSIYQTRDQHIWVGSEGGLNELDEDDNVIASYSASTKDSQSLGANPVLAITEDEDENLWLGTWSGGMDFFNRKNKTFKNYFPSNVKENTLSSPYVWSLLFQDVDTLWVGTETGGLNRFDRNSEKFDYVKAFTTFKEGQEFSTVAGLITGLIKDRDGNIWISSLNGVYLLDLNDMTFIAYRQQGAESKVLSSDRAVTIFEHSNGDIWIGTQDGGINIIHREDDTITHILGTDGLPSINVTSLIEDDDSNVWAATLNGIVKIDLSDNMRVYVLKKQHGIAGNQFNRDASLKMNDGRLYFGGLSGLTIIDPKALDFSSPAREVVLTDLLIQHREVSVDKFRSPLKKSVFKSKELTLKHNENAFSLSFSAQNYLSPGLNDYQYRLLGYDDRWVNNLNKNYANYTNLNPGKYRFEVKASNIYGDLSGQPTSLEITIEPPPWLSWWAYVIYFGLIALSFYLFFAYYRLKIRSRIYHELSITDALTQVYNRHGMSQFIEGYFRNNEMRQGLSLMVIGLDDFKPMNDSLGHSVGDSILVKSVQVMKNSLRSGDHIGRWGGDEFVALIKSTNSDTSYQTAEKLRRAIDNENFWNENESVSVTASVGVAVCKPDESFDSLFKRADEAMYNAKVNGKNQTILG